jgi:hypothetical protein
VAVLIFCMTYLLDRIYQTNSLLQALTPEQGTHLLSVHYSELRGLFHMLLETDPSHVSYREAYTLIRDTAIRDISILMTAEGDASISTHRHFLSVIQEAVNLVM